MKSEPRVLSVNVALAQPLRSGDSLVLSAIGKRPVAGRIAVGPHGLEGDEQADHGVHGGLSRAVYAYPVQHYAFWQTVRAQARVGEWGDTLPHGFVGENLTLEGIDEGRVWIGDRLRFPDCVLAVNAPRDPCEKFDAVMGFSQAAKLMRQSGYCGFYLSVLVPGSIAAGERFAVEPGRRDVNVAELFEARWKR
ncbi:MAG TPA: MOSC domain-containing protein [Burkholderiaceae bacterium]|jgi:MOSC domain-containing protein YiiM|nr:MOSC domain-containing protein [Burkholderiaceae bacterium]